jgi:RimJ/RimL family protein N-acetyltransferase
MRELRRADYEMVRTLFRPLRFHLASAAVLDGSSPGQVFVDEPTRPRTAFMLSPEGCYLAGDPGNDAFNRAFNRDVVSRRALGEDIRVLFLVVHPEHWRDRLPSLLAPCPPMVMRRRHYVCRAPCYDWRARLPDGCAVRRIDRSLLDSSGLTVPDRVIGWMEHNWGSIGSFFEDGFGFVTISAGEIVSWSLADCVSGDQCEIGIHTLPARRRRGLATATAAATVEHALSHGFTTVGWHCPDDNLGSIGTAEKVGFRRERDYVAYFASLDEVIDHGKRPVLAPRPTAR